MASRSDLQRCRPNHDQQVRQNQSWRRSRVAWTGRPNANFTVHWFYFEWSGNKLVAIPYTPHRLSTDDGMLPSLFTANKARDRRDRVHFKSSTWILKRPTNCRISGRNPIKLLRRCRERNQKLHSWGYSRLDAAFAKLTNRDAAS